MTYTRSSMFDRVLAALLSILMIVAVLPVSVIGVEAEVGATYGTVSTYTGGTITNNGTAQVEVLVEETTLSWSAANATRGEGWWVGIDVVAPDGYSEDATYKVKTNPNVAYGSAKSFADMKDGENDIQLWFAVSPESLEKFASESRNLTMTYAFDWDADGAYEQEIVFSVVPGEKIILTKAGEQVYPVIYGTVTALTGGVVNNNGTGRVEVIIEETTLSWSAANATRGEGWWVGIDVVAPEGFSADATYKVKTNPNAAYGSAKSFAEMKDGENDIQLWFAVSPESLEKFASESRHLTMTYAFDWDADGVYEQEVVFSVVPGEKIVLMKGEEQVYPEIVNGGTVTALTGGVVNNNGASRVEVVIEETTLAWVEESATRGEGWWVGIDVVAPDGYSEDATYKVKTNPTAEYGSAKSFAEMKDGENDIQLWFAVSPESLEKFASESRNLIMTYAFDWDADGVYEQEVVFSVVPSEKIVLTKAGEQVYPVIYGTVGALTGGVVNNNGTSHVEVVIEETTLAWVEASALRGEGWWVGIDVVAPEGFSADATYKVKTNPAAEYGSAKSFAEMKDGENDIQLWFAVSPESLEKFASESRNLIMTYAFDWDADGVYEQEVVFSVVPGEKIVLTTKVTVSTNEGGSASLNGDTTGETVVEGGTNVAVVITPEEGYQISKVTVNGQETVITDASEAFEYTIEKISKDTAIVASFVKVYTVTVTGDENGTVSTSPAGVGGSVTVETGSEVVVTATPKEGYRVTGVKINNVAQTVTGENDSGYEVKLTADQAYSVEVTFAPNVYTVAKETPENGDFEIKDPSVEHGGSAVVVVTPGEGYTIDSITVKGATVSEVVKDATTGIWFTVSGITSDVKVVVTFKLTAKANISDVSKDTQNAAIRKNETLFVVKEGDKVTFRTGKTGMRMYSGADLLAGDEQCQEIAISGGTTITGIELYYQADNERYADWHVVEMNEIKVVTDAEDPTISVLEPSEEAIHGYYNGDVELKVEVEDVLNSSGINTVYYEVFNNGVRTQGYGSNEKDKTEGILYQFAVQDPKYEDFVTAWASSDVDKNIIVNAELNNSDNVKVVVTVIDNAGNVATREIPLKICVSKPTIDVTYIDDPAAIDTFKGVTYYDANRVAKIVITGRTSVFEASLAPVVEVIATKGDPAEKTTWYAEYWQTTEDPNDPDAAIHEYLIHFNGDANYEFTVNYTDVFRNNCQHTSDKFAVDHKKPTASVTIGEASTWSKLLEKLTFGLWKNEKVTVKATAEDTTSPIKKLEMYRTDATEILTFAQLDALYAEGKFSDYESFTVAEDERFVVYIRVEDYAGHYDYISSDGYVVDKTAADITLKPEDTDLSHNDIPLYNGDVDVLIDVVENKDGSYAGIKEVKYWVTCDGEVSQSEVILYSFTNATPKHDDLLHEFTETVIIEAAKNNSCNVVLYVTVTDNAGNVKTESVAVDIDSMAPVITVDFDNDNAYKDDGDRGYYPANRTATITITERTGHFEAVKATAGIKIKAVDAKGEPIVVNGVPLEVDDSEGYLVDITKLFGAVAWTTEEGATPDDATHKIELSYNYDANYTFAISYADLASNGNEGVITEFTVDKVKPTATITAESQTWDELLASLTFGLFSKEDVTVSATGDDVTSPIIIEYYKTNATEILTFAQLDALYAEGEFFYESFTVTEDERFVVYLKVTDYAGNYIFINTDGYVVDKTAADITLEPEDTDLSHNDIPLYNGDVDVLIDVVENKDGSYAGIKEVKYWVTCDGEVSQSEVILYSFTNATPKHDELLREFTQTVTIEAAKNNSCNVVLYVTVTDNAGNVKTESVAVDIDITAPTITVDFDNDNAYKVIDGKGYFPKARKATVVITERAAHFNAVKATGSIKVTAVDVTGKVVIEDCSALVGAWVTKGTGNEATHTATINFSADANYEFTLSYEDLATNECLYENVKFADGTVASRDFAVDKTKPTGTVTAGELGTWDKLIQTLTFGLWSKDTVDVTGTAKDVTTPIESVSYYKTSETTAKTVDELKAITTWTAFEGITVPADEQFVVYIRIVDYAGNVTYLSTNGVIVDDTAPVVESVKPEITITPEPANGIYHSDVTVAVSVVDPMVGDTDAYAGLKEIRYEIYSLGVKTQDGVLYSFDTTDPTHNQLQQSWSKMDAIVVDKELNNSNDVKIVVYAVDNAGNENQAECDIKIDITAPTIEVTYDNNDGDTSFTESVYFKENRVAMIVVTERNFDPEMVKLVITNTDNYVPEISAWTTVAGPGNGDGTTHIAYVVFDRDGDYTFEISCTDTATNVNTAVDYADSLAPTAFTVDKTAPVVDVVYDNNDALNDNYYKAERVATITVTEHNFETGRIVIRLKATDDGVAVALPVVSEWTTDGDVHTATITYAADARYVFDFDYTDKAGNATADIAEQTFYVDKTNPVLVIEKIVDESANNDEGDIGFVMTATDTNFDVFTPVLTAVVKNGDAFETKQLEIGEVTDIKNGKVFTVTNLEADGIYRITCTVVDKAGNAYSEVILEKADGGTYVEKRTSKDVLVTFSVNRDGSTFEIDAETADLVKQYYIQNVENDVVIVEINADPLKEYAVTLNGKELVKDTDYTVTEEGGNGAWIKYTYAVNKALFAEEGEYKLVVSSKDKADNDAFSDVKDATVEFIVDRTAPVVTISGITTDGRYQTESQIVTLIPTDDGGALKTLIVNLVDNDGTVIEEVINLTGEALISKLEANGGKITFEISEGLYQNVQIICGDRAVGNAEETNVCNVVVKNVSVSSSAFMIFWANKPLRWGVIGGVSAVIIALTVFIVLKKKKSKTAK